MTRNILDGSHKTNMSCREQVHREELLENFDEQTGRMFLVITYKKTGTESKAEDDFLFSVMATGVFKTGSRGQHLSEPKSLDSWFSYATLQLVRESDSVQGLGDEARDRQSVQLGPKTPTNQPKQRRKDKTS